MKKWLIGGLAALTLCGAYATLVHWGSYDPAQRAILIAEEVIGELESGPVCTDAVRLIDNQWHVTGTVSGEPWEVILVCSGVGSIRVWRVEGDGEEGRNGTDGQPD